MEKQINEKIIEMDREYPFLFCFKSDFWMEQQMIRQNIFEHTKRQTPKMTFVYVLRQPLGSLFSQKIPMSNCMPRLVRMIAIQQRAPRRMDFPLDLIIATRLVLRPIALMAMIISKDGSQQRSQDEVENENGEDFFKLYSLVVVLLTALPIGEEESNRDNS